MTKRIPVAVLGATGSVGQRFVALLAEHPWFELRALTASDRNVGKKYRDAVTWVQASPIPESVADCELGETRVHGAPDCPLVFSALDSSVAGSAEERFAADGRIVVSNAKNHRMDPDVPLLVPEVNPDHAELVRAQRWGGGAILTNPNCSTIGLVLALAPLSERFGIEAVHVVTMQALSGAGLPGVGGMQAVDNVIPYIGGEEDKLETETAKILGRFATDCIDPADVRVSAACNRVSVIDGHLACASVKLRTPATEEDVLAAWREWNPEPQQKKLPSAPHPPVVYLDDPAWPQPRLHRDLGNGMATSVGRLRPCPLFDYKFVTLSHNTLRGAAGGAILVAELAASRGLIPDFTP